MTVLANACKQNNLAVVRILLNKASVDIDFNKKDRCGDTCLMHAVRTSNTELVRLLVNTMQRLSIDIDVKNNTDITPYLEAKRFGFNEIANVLTKDGNACQSIMICPLIFDEYREDAYNEVDATQRSFVGSNKELKWKKLNQNWSKRTVAGRNRLIKSAQEKKSDTDKSKERGNEMKGKHPNTKVIHQPKLERSRSELESANKVLLVKESNVDNIKDHENKKENKQTEQDNSLIPVNCEGKIQDDLNRENKTEFEKNGIHQKQATTELERQADNEAMKGKSTWLRRLQKRGPTWKRRLLGSEVGDENCQEDKRPEMYRQSTLSNGSMRMLSTDNPSTPLVHHRSSSNLSVYFADSHQSIPLTRPVSAYNIREKHEDFVQDSYHHSLLQEPVKPCITYEEVFALCPEMKGDISRKWYSDIRWMLALKAQQNSATYLPAQQQRYHHDSAGSEFRNDSEGSRSSRRTSVFDLKRPAIKKRHTTISPTVLRKFNED